MAIISNFPGGGSGVALPVAIVAGNAEILSSTTNKTNSASGTVVTRTVTMKLGGAVRILGVYSCSSASTGATTQLQIRKNGTVQAYASLTARAGVTDYNYIEYDLAVSAGDVITMALKNDFSGVTLVDHYFQMTVLWDEAKAALIDMAVTSYTL